MNTRPIAGHVDYAALAAPPGICRNCYVVFRATTPRPPFVFCWHSKTAAKPRKSGGWKVIGDLTPSQLAELDELAKLRRQ